MSKQIILDLDSVIADFWAGALSPVNAHLGTNHHERDILHYNVTDAIGLQYSDFVNILVDQEILQNLPVYEGAAEATTKLVAAGFDISIITSRGFHPNAHEITAKWLKQHDIHHHQMMIVPSGTKKSVVVRQLGSKFLCAVDDHLDNLVDLTSEDLLHKSVLINQPWNAHFDAKGSLHHRFDSLADWTTQFLK